MNAEQTPLSRDEQLREAVLRVVNGIQARRIADRRDTGNDARLARLRRAVVSVPGSVPDVWQDTVGALPDSLGSGETPTDWECAAHESITLYALHQQSSSVAVHRKGQNLGAAAKALIPQDDWYKDNPIRSRFQAVALAQTPAGVSQHLRSLIQLLRGKNIPLDYGQLAVDLRQLRSAHDADLVRLRWGRAFSRAPKSESDAGTVPTDSVATHIESN